MKKLLIAAAFFFLYACATQRDTLPPALTNRPDWKTLEVPATQQDLSGDPEAGLRFLLYGNYLGTGVPWSMVEKRFTRTVRDTLWQRSGPNAHAPYLMNVFEAANDVPVMNGNCFTCHAGALNGRLVPGLGNSFSDYRRSFKPMADATSLAVRIKYGKRSPEWEAFEDFGRYFKKMAPHIRTGQPGANPAFRLAEACMMHRNPDDLSFREEPQFSISPFPVATDVPPLWNVKKKNALYYDGIGRGDFSKLIFQASVLGIPDSAAARQAIAGFKDVLAWLHTLEPPAFPGKINEPAAARGQLIFEEKCAKCHGAYGAQPSYPNKVVALDVVKTDPVYVQYIHQSGITAWYNSGWFAQSEPRSWFEPLPGYIAPPLDGIWATAPYLHNGSVPTIEALLHSPSRPVRWQRSGDSRDYDLEKVGWKYTVPTRAKKKGWTYDTTLPGYGNGGHTFGDALNSEDRAALIEYLKTL